MRRFCEWWLRRARQRQDAKYGEGARAAFRAGERIPLKGIWFTVEEVGALDLRLTAEGLTRRQVKRAGLR